MLSSYSQCLLAEELSVTPADNLQKVLDSSQDGDVLVLRAGRYLGNFVIAKQIELRGEHGVIIDKLTLTPGGSLSGLELIPNTWHTVYPQTEAAVIMEIKEGPYTPAKESDFAQWAPQEGDSTVQEFLCWIQNAEIGEKYVGV